MICTHPGEKDRYHNLFKLEQKMVNPKAQQFFFSSGRIEVDRLMGEMDLTFLALSSITKELVKLRLTPLREAT